jgi:hypothetical protein
MGPDDEESRFRALFDAEARGVLGYELRSGLGCGA